MFVRESLDGAGNRMVAPFARFVWLTPYTTNIKVSLYEPEIMSKFLDLSDMSLHASSFSLGKETV